MNAPMKAPIMTGASRGIGRAVAFARDEFAIAVNCASNTPQTVQSAGVMKMLPLSTSNEQAFDAMFATNVRGMFNALKQAARRLWDGSRMVTLSTSVIALSLLGYGPYARNRSIALDQWTGAARQWRVPE